VSSVSAKGKSVRKTRLVPLLSLVFLLAGCAEIAYRQTDSGEFQGKLDVRWIEPDRFVYVPNEADPLRFKTAQGQVITPRVMYTDGGSIPRLFWGIPGYSPWGYAPAYIVHDWLFEAHHCQYPEFAWVSFNDSARLLAEGIKTLMETEVAPKDATVFYSIYEAVRTPIAERLWNAPDRCSPPEPGPTFRLRDRSRLLFTIDMKDVPRVR
jgi:hypothetical protein